MYLQNKLLWEYMQKLYETNKENAKRLRSHVHSLHVELLGVHRERALLADRIREAEQVEVVSKLLEEQKRDELKLCAEEEMITKEIQSQLEAARNENSALEASLHEQFDRMRVSN
jgi:hypothetical protein